MPAMPPSATANAIPGLAAIAAKLGAGGNTADAATTESVDLAAFATHFQRLLGQQLTIEVAPGLSQSTTAAAQAATGEEATDELAALLPFIEALGLTQAAVSTPTSPAPAQATEPETPELVTDATIVPLAMPATAPTAITSAPPATTPAISAAKPSPQGQAHGLAFQTPDQSVATAAPAAPSNVIADAGAPASIEELSAGREFSAELVSAIAASKEQPHAAGNVAAAAHQAIASSSPHNAHAPNADTVVSQPVGSPGWTEELGNRVTWLASRAESKAELVLTPPQMGRIEINLTVKGDQATASFVSSNPVVREALEAALPRLREVLADAGIQLGQSQVSAENARQWAQQEKHGDNSASDPARANAMNTAISSVSSGSLPASSGLKGGRSLVDVFA